MHVNNDATFLYTSWSLGHCQNYLEQVTFFPYTVESTILVLKKKKKVVPWSRELDHITSFKAYFIELYQKTTQRYILWHTSPLMKSALFNM